MRIYFERSGGFTGMQVNTAVDINALPAEEAQNLQQLLDAAHFFELPEALGDAGGADYMHYTLTVETDEGRHTVQTTDEAAPDELRPLLRRLTILARKYPAD